MVRQCLHLNCWIDSSALRRAHWLSLLFPDAFDLLVTAQRRVSVLPRQRRRHVRGVAPTNAIEGRFSVVSPRNVGDVRVRNADSVERFGDWPIEKGLRRGLVKEHV